MNKVQQAKEYAREILNSVGLHDWSIWVNSSYTKIAKTQFNTKRIYYSMRFITIASREDFLRATMHEAAHALVGYEEGHGEKFISKCRELSPSMAFDSYCENALINKYLFYCPNCEKSTTFSSNEDGWCVDCALSGKEVKLEVSENVLVPTVWASTP